MRRSRVGTMLKSNATVEEKRFSKKLEELNEFRVSKRNMLEHECFRLLSLQRALSEMSDRKTLLLEKIKSLSHSVSFQSHKRLVYQKSLGIVIVIVIVVLVSFI